MENNVKISLIGLTFIVTIIAAIWGYSFLKGHDIFRKSRTFYVEFDDINGLLNTTPVEVRGYQVGQVTEIKFSDNKASSVIIAIRIDNDIDIPSNTIVQIYETDMLGSKGLRLLIPDSYTSLAKDGDTLTGELSPTLQDKLEEALTPLKDKSEKLMSEIDTILVALKDVANSGELQQSMVLLKQTLADTRSLTYKLDTLFDKDSRLDKTITQLHTISNNTAQLTDTLKNLDIKQTVDRLNSLIATTDSLMKYINSGQGTIGRLTKEDEVYVRLDSIMQQIEILLKDMQQDPKKYMKISVF